MIKIRERYGSGRKIISTTGIKSGMIMMFDVDHHTVGLGFLRDKTLVELVFDKGGDNTITNTDNQLPVDFLRNKDDFQSFICVVAELSGLVANECDYRYKNMPVYIFRKPS